MGVDVGVDVGISVAEVRDRTRAWLCGSLVSRPRFAPTCDVQSFASQPAFGATRVSQKQVLRVTIYLRTQIDKSRRAGLHSTVPCAPDNPAAARSACIVPA